MRYLTTAVIALSVCLVNGTMPGDLAAETRSDRPEYDRKWYNTSPPESGKRPGHGKHYGKRDRPTLGEELAFRDYRMHMQKHERIMERYGGGSYAVIDRPYHTPRRYTIIRHRGSGSRSTIRRR